MPVLPHARRGEVLLVRNRPLPFSFFPVTRGIRRYGLFDTLFAVSPWAVMQAAVQENLTGAEQSEARAFLEQAQDFYAAATSRLAANPLLFYYAFVNVGKSLIRTRGYHGSLDQAMHGLSAQTVAGGVELQDSEIVVKDTGGALNIYPELVTRLGFARPPDGTSYPVPELLPQIVIGHRLWRQGQRAKERFVALDEVEIMHDSGTGEIWLRLYLVRGDLSRYDISRIRLLAEGDLVAHFQEIQIRDTGHDSSLLCLEQRNAIAYTGRPTDNLMELVEMMRPRLWRIASTIPEDGYRKYYVHLTPPAETHRVPQLASMWLLFYYFGSVVRYRPHLFDNVTAGSFGAFVTEFISAQSEQLLYLLASEMVQREVAKPAII